ncbi:MAG: hypothetical protein AAB320_05550 [Elusimicrobiota bacterium]
MQTIIAVSLAVIAVEIAVGMAALVYAALKIQKAAEAVEVTAYRVDEQVMNFGSRINDGWMGTGIKAALALAGHLFSRGR